MKLAGWIAAVLLVASAAAAARPGKVVRVERRPVERKRPIAICNAMLGGGDRLTCLTGDPGASGPLFLISKQGDYERLEVTSRHPSPIDSCSIGLPFDVKIRPSSSMTPGHHDTFAIGGVEPIAGRTRLIDTDKITPPERGVEVGLAIDLVGDGRPELVATSRQCPETQRTERRLAGKTVHQSICVAIWERPPRADGWRKNNEAVLHFCR